MSHRIEDFCMCDTCQLHKEIWDNIQDEFWDTYNSTSPNSKSVVGKSHE